MSGNYILNRAALTARLGDDPEIFNIMVETYLEDVERNCAALAGALGRGADILQREAHTFKSLLATVGDEDGRLAALAVEHRARDGDLAGIEEAVAALQARMRHVADVLRRETGR